MGGQASWLLPAALVALVARPVGARAARRAPTARAPRCSSGAAGCWSPPPSSATRRASSTPTTRSRWRRRSRRSSRSAAQRLWQHRATLRARVLAAARRRADRRLVLRAARPHAGLAAVAARARPRGDDRRRRRPARSRPLLGRRAPRRRRRRARRGARRLLRRPARLHAPDVATAHTGSIPSAGPATARPPAAGGGRRRRSAARRRRRARGRRRRRARRLAAAGAARPPAARAGALRRPRRAAPRRGRRRSAAARRRGGGTRERLARAGQRARVATPARYRWVAATDGSTSAASYELATGGDPVMAIGGFNGNGGELSLAQFIRDVRAGEIHYFIASGGRRRRPGRRRLLEPSTITAWVQSHYSATTIGGVTVYDLQRAERAGRAQGARRRSRRRRVDSAGGRASDARARGRYRARSLWLDQLDEPLDAAPALAGDHDCDVAIVGAGFTGLWTAYYLQDAPAAICASRVIEREIAGFGPSGRNGGWAVGGLAGSAQAFGIARDRDRAPARAARHLRRRRRDRRGRRARADRLRLPQGGRADGRHERPAVAAAAGARGGRRGGGPRSATAACSTAAQAEALVAMPDAARRLVHAPRRADRPGAARARARGGVRAPRRDDLRAHRGDARSSAGACAAPAGPCAPTIVLRATESYTTQLPRPAPALPAALLADDRDRAAAGDEAGSELALARRAADRRRPLPLLLRAAHRPTGGSRSAAAARPTA